MPREKDKERALLQRAPKFHIEVDGGIGGVAFLVNGVLGVSEFSDTEIRLILKYGSVMLSGYGLSLLLFDNGTVEVGGAVTDISIKYIKGGKKNAPAY